MQRLRRLLPRVLVESFFIVLSVLLALAANDWRENRARRQRSAEARRAFSSEIAANREMLASDQFLEHHRRLREIYGRAMDAGAADPGTLFDTGLHPASLRDAAWRSFSGGNIFSDFSSADVLLLSDIYGAQNDLQQRNAEFLNALMNPRSDRDTPAYQRDSARTIAMFLNDLVPAEERLLKSYDRAIAQLRQQPGGK